MECLGKEGMETASPQFCDHHQGFAEQWPKMEESEEEFPRNVAVFRLKDALEKYLEEAQSAAQSLKGNLVNPTVSRKNTIQFYSCIYCLPQL